MPYILSAATIAVSYLFIFADSGVALDKNQLAIKSASVTARSIFEIVLPPTLNISFNLYSIINQPTAETIVSNCLEWWTYRFSQGKLSRLPTFSTARLIANLTTSSLQP